jgi:protease-4
MKQFFKFMFASMLGFVLCIVLLIFFLVGMVAATFSSMSSDKEVSIKENSILHMKLDYSIDERTDKQGFAAVFADENDSRVGLNDILANIRKAKSDDNIKGIYLDLSMVFAGYATLEEIRNALNDFKKSGKFIIAYSEIYTEQAYYLASVADRIYLHPSGDLIFNGIFANLTFFKGTLDKMGVKVQAIKHGSFKGAVEPFIMEKMSDSNRVQITAFATSLYNHYLDSVASSRHTTREALFEIADKLKIQNASDAKNYKMVDDLFFKDQVLDELRKRTNIEKDARLNLVKMSKYKNVTDPNKSKSADKIAVIYAVGDIGGGEGDDNSIGSERISEAIRKARTDKTIKAIVLRVNSPGGSALASDVIWREVVLAKAEKPVIVSMGDVAASGGYYISVGADTIVAEPNTITGSIGVFGLIPNAQELLTDKMGITFDGVKLGEFSDLGSINRPLTPAETAIIQHSVDTIYNDFVRKVASGRGMTYEEVDAIAEGRVWSAIDAKRIGLVDVLGGIDVAISIAANKAGISDYKITALPLQKDPFEMLIKNLSGGSADMLLKRELGEHYQMYMQLRGAMKMKGVQARMPFTIELN